MQAIPGGWPAYGRQSYRRQFADGVQWRVSGKRSRQARALTKPGKVRIMWPNGWPGWRPFASD